MSLFASGRSRGLAALLLLLAAALRLMWPLTDPPDSLSWSGGIFTDPAYNYLPARLALAHGDGPTIDLTARLIYPLLNAIVWGLGHVVPIGPVSVVGLAVVLGLLTLAISADLARRVAGPTAALGVLAVGAILHWLILFARILMAEHVVALLLAGAAWFALGRRPLAWALAAMLAVGAVLFGKYHAVGSAAGILLFVVWRNPQRRAWGAVAGASILLGLAWATFLFLPHRAEILAWVTGYTSAGQAGPPILTSGIEAVLELFRTYRNGFLIHRAPVVSLFGGLFVIWTLGNGAARRRRLEDGSAIFAFWFAGAFVYHAIFPYTPPRYFIPMVYPLIGAAVCQALEATQGGTLPRMRRLDEWIPGLSWFVFLGVGVPYAAVHYDRFRRMSIPLEARSAIDETGPSWLVATFGPVAGNVLWGTLIGLLLFAAFRTIAGRASEARRRFSPRAGSQWVLGAAVACVILNAGQWTWWATHRTERLARIRDSLALMVGEDAVILGAYAPVLTEGTSAVPVWYPLSSAEGGGGLLAQRGFTHVLVAEPGGITPETLDQDYPGVAERMRLVHSWRVRMSFVRRLHLYRLAEPLPGKAPLPRPTRLELALQAANANQVETCLQQIEMYRNEGGVETPEMLLYEAVGRSGAGDLVAAEALLLRAVALDPLAPLLQRNLGMLAWARGDHEAARRHWRECLRLEPENQEAAQLLRQAP